MIRGRDKGQIKQFNDPLMDPGLQVMVAVHRYVKLL